MPTPVIPPDQLWATKKLEIIEGILKTLAKALPFVKEVALKSIVEAHKIFGAEEYEKQGVFPRIVLVEGRVCPASIQEIAEFMLKREYEELKSSIESALGPYLIMCSPDYKRYLTLYKALKLHFKFELPKSELYYGVEKCESEEQLIEQIILFHFSNLFPQMDKIISEKSRGKLLHSSQFAEQLVEFHKLYSLLRPAVAEEEATKVLFNLYLKAYLLKDEPKRVGYASLKAFAELDETDEMLMKRVLQARYLSASFIEIEEIEKEYRVLQTYLEGKRKAKRLPYYPHESLKEIIYKESFKTLMLEIFKPDKQLFDLFLASPGHILLFEYLIEFIKESSGEFVVEAGFLKRLHELSPGVAGKIAEYQEAAQIFRRILLAVDPKAEELPVYYFLKLDLEKILSVITRAKTFEEQFEFSKSCLVLFKKEEKAMKVLEAFHERVIQHHLLMEYTQAFSATQAPSAIHLKIVKTLLELRTSLLHASLHDYFTPLLKSKMEGLRKSKHEEERSLYVFLKTHLSF